jgi:hypothetical protein
MKILLSIIAKIGLAIVGWFVLFDLYLITLGIARGTFSFSPNLWKGPWYLLHIAVMDVCANALFFLYSLPSLLPKAREVLLSAGIDTIPLITRFGLTLATDLALILCLVVTIVLYERWNKKSPLTTFAFYFVVPSLILFALLKIA